MENGNMNYEKLAVAVNEIDDGCSRCIVNFLNKLEKADAVIISNMVNDLDFTYTKYVYSDKNKEWERD
jgi:hypothetical protein